MGKREMRKELAALSFSEKVKILQKLRKRSLVFADARLRASERTKMPIKLFACIESHRQHELDEENGYWSHDEFPAAVASLCEEFSLPYSQKFVSIAVIGSRDDESIVCPAFGESVLLNSDAVLPLIQIGCSDDIQNVAEGKRGSGVLLKDLSNVSTPGKIGALEAAVAKRSNAKYAEARIHVGLKREHVAPGWRSEEDDPISQAGLWPDKE
jgi:hypothetical protein